MASDRSFLVTGATGHVGGAALDALRRAAPGSSTVCALVRSRERAAERLPPGTPCRLGDYGDRESLRAAFAGVTDLLFIASDGAARDVLAQHANVIDAARDAGVGRIVFTSIVDVEASSPFYFAPVYRDAERRLQASGIPCTLLRCGLYWEFVWDSWVQPAQGTGLITAPAGSACIAPITRRDVGRAAAAALLDATLAGKTFCLAGPRACGFEQLAEAASRRFGRAVRYQPGEPADYLLECWATMDDPWPHAFSSLLASIREGRFAATSDDAARLIGRPLDPLPG